MRRGGSGSEHPRSRRASGLGRCSITCHGKAVPFRPTAACRAAPRDRPHRRGTSWSADGTRRDHRSVDLGQADAGVGLRVSARARGRDDASAGEPSQGHPSARHCRGHLARDHLDVHLRAGAVFHPRRPIGWRRCHARFRPLPFRLHGAVRAAYGSGKRGRGGVGIAGRPRPGAGLHHRGGRRLVERPRVRRRAQGHCAASLRRPPRSSGRRPGLRRLPRCPRHDGQGGRGLERSRGRVERGVSARGCGVRRGIGGPRQRLRRSGTAGLGAAGRQHRGGHRRAGGVRRLGTRLHPRRHPCRAL